MIGRTRVSYMEFVSVNSSETRMHSSRMRTARLLPVSPSMHCSQGVYLVLGGRGVPGPRGCTCPVGGTWSGGVYLVQGVYLPGGYKVWGVYLPGGYLVRGCVPGLGGTWPWGAYLVLVGVYLVPGGTWSGGCTWSGGYLVLGGVPGPGGVPSQVFLPVYRQTRVKT